MADAAPVPAHWRRVITYIDESGWPAVLICAGMAYDPARLARDEAAGLRAAGAGVRVDGTGHPCVDPRDPAVIAWAAELDRVADEATGRIEDAMAEVLNG